MSPARNVESHLQSEGSAQPPSDLSGRWCNALGSEMTIVQDGGTLSGRYRTSVGAVPHGTEFPLTGLVAGRLVSFVVDFGAYGSLTAWVGHHVEDGGTDRLSTLWQMARVQAHLEDAERPWSAIMAGADEFERAVE